MLIIFKGRIEFCIEVFCAFFVEWILIVIYSPWKLKVYSDFLSLYDSALVDDVLETIFRMDGYKSLSQ